MKVTPHFSVDEFGQRAGRGVGSVDYPEEWVYPRLLPLCETLEVVRSELKKPVHIISGYRSPAYNKALPGAAKKSQHMEGRAADIVVPDVDAKVVHAVVLDLHRRALLPHLGGLGAYPRFTHLDVRPSKRLVRWGGSRVDS